MSNINLIPPCSLSLLLSCPLQGTFLRTPNTLGMSALPNRIKSSSPCQLEVYCESERKRNPPSTRPLRFFFCHRDFRFIFNYLSLSTTWPHHWVRPEVVGRPHKTHWTCLSLSFHICKTKNKWSKIIFNLSVDGDVME